MSAEPGSGVPDHVLADPTRQYTWLSSPAATEAQAVIRRAVAARLGGTEDEAAALAAWILEDLAVAGLVVVAGPNDNHERVRR